MSYRLTDDKWAEERPSCCFCLGGTLTIAVISILLALVLSIIVR